MSKIQFAIGLWQDRLLDDFWSYIDVNLAIIKYADVWRLKVDGFTEFGVISTPAFSPTNIYTDLVYLRYAIYNRAGC